MNSWKPVSTFINFTTKGITPKYVKHSSILVLNQKCIRNNRIDYSFAQFTDDTKKLANAKFVKKGDILANSTGVGTAGRIAFVKDLPKEHHLIVDSHILILRCGSFNEAQCLNYALFSFEKTLMSFMTGSSGQSELDKVVLLNLKTKMPTEPESQKAISSVLSTLDAKIELNNRINEELEGMAKLLYDYWFVQFDFPMTAPQAAALGKPKLEGQPYRASGGKMIYNESLKREIPEGWKFTILSEFANITMGQSPPGDTYNQEGAGVVFFQGATDFGWRFPQVREFTTSPSRFAKEGDILLSVRAPVGTLNIADQDCCVGRGVAALNSKSGHDSFLFEVILYFKMIFDRRNSSGTTFGSINKDDLYSLGFACPPENSTLLDAFEKKMKPAHKAILNNHRQNLQLTQLRDWLLPMLMNGQVTVA